jgi:hypothetical protein
LGGAVPAALFTSENFSCRNQAKRSTGLAGGPRLNGERAEVRLCVINCRIVCRAVRV